MKHQAQQFEFAGAERVFNLAGEKIRKPEPTTQPQPSRDQQPELFTDWEDLSKRYEPV